MLSRCLRMLRCCLTPPTSPIPPCEERQNSDTFEALLELKQAFSGADGMTSDSEQVGILLKKFYALPEPCRKAQEARFVSLILENINWKEAFPFVERIDGITDISEGASFKQYFLEHNIPEILCILKKGLDAESLAVVDHFMFKALRLPEYPAEIAGKHFFAFSALLRKMFQSPTEKTSEERYEAELPTYRQNFHYAEFNAYFEPSVFLFHHGLRSRSKAVLDYIRHKDFIDGGAWIGDSALVLGKYYEPKKIHSFEISPATCKRYDDVMRANGVESSCYVIVNEGLGERKGKCLFVDNSGEGTSLLARREGEEREITVCSIDAYVAAQRLHVGFIKLDLEGFGLAALKGARETIISQLPVLSLSLYHTPEEFFETKPYLESLTDAYTLHVERHHIDYTNCWDTVLMAIPKTLL